MPKRSFTYQLFAKMSNTNESTNDGDQVDPANNTADTQQSDQSTPPANQSQQGGHGEGTNQSDASTSNNTSNSGNQTLDSGSADDAQALAQKREEGKLQKLQQQYKKDKETLQRLQQAAAKDPDTMRNIMKNMGHDDSYIENQVNNLKAQGYWQQQQQTNQNVQQQNNGVQNANNFNNQNLDVDQLTQQLMQRMEEKQQVKNAAQKLAQAYPELVNADPQEAEQYRQRIAQAEYIAQAKLNAGVENDLADAIVKEYGNLSGKTQEQIEQARQQGKMEGLALRATEQVSNESGSQGASTANNSQVNLTEIEQKVSDMWGMTPEEYAAAKQSTGRVE